MSDREEDTARRRVVPPRILTRDEALSNYATIAHHYNEFVEKRLPQIERTVKLTYDMLLDHIAREEGIDAAQLRLHTEHPHLAGPRITEYHPDQTPMGGIRFDPAQWEGIQKRFEEQERQRSLKDAEIEGGRKALETQKKRLMFWVKLLGAMIPIIAAIVGVVTHFLHN